jgi:hypothetical protein
MEDNGDYSLFGDTYDLNSIIDDYNTFNAHKKRKTNKYGIELDKVYCCVCIADSTERFVYYAKIGELNNIADNSMFLSPCGKHFICKECLKTVALDFENHPINNNYSLIRCLNSGDGCLTPEDIPYFFEHSDIRKVLTEEQYMMYITYAERYEYLGYDVIKCNKLNIFTGERCDGKIAVVHDDIANTEEGYLLVECPETVTCGNRICYNCRNYVSYMYDACKNCSNLHEYDNPFALNKFLIKETDEEITLLKQNGALDQQEFALVSRKVNEESDYLYRNCDITVDIALSYIYKILYDDQDKISLQCPICLNYFYKSEKCSALKHCGIERCYSCGKIQNKSNIFGIGDHWSEMGVNGCPRFDTAPYWDHYARCEYMCSDEVYNSNYCHSHIKGECSKAEHKFGKTRLNHERKQALVYHFLKSLLPDLREEVFNNVEDVMNTGFMRSVFRFLDNNKKYINYYTPLTFLTLL